MDITSKVDVLSRPCGVRDLPFALFPAFLEVEVRAVEVGALLVCHFVKMDDYILKQSDR